VGEIIACANQKGGVGKTTTVVNLATALAATGRRILVVDLDPQGNATSGFGVDKSAVTASVYDAVVDTVPIGQLLVSTAAGVTMIPSAIALAGLEVELASLPQRERRLRRALEPLRDSFDYLFLDCPPSLGLITVNALTAADSVLVPVQCEYYALEGLGQLVATIQLVRDNLNPSLEVRGVLLTMFDARTNLSADVRDEVRRHFGSAVYDAVVPRSVRLSEAPSHGVPIALYSPDSKGARAYASAAAEFLARAGEEPAVRPDIRTVSEPLAGVPA
jgi:chromosome partitioning protein